MSGRDTGRCNGEREKGKGRKSREQEQTFPTSVALPKYPQWSCGMGKTRSSEHNPDLSSWVQGPCQWSLHCLYWQEPAVKNWSQSQKPWYEIQCLSWHFLMARLDLVLLNLYFYVLNVSLKEAWTVFLFILVSAGLGIEMVSISWTNKHFIPDMVRWVRHVKQSYNCLLV